MLLGSLDFLVGQVNIKVPTLLISTNEPTL
jgi:hypothetical protein